MNDLSVSRRRLMQIGWGAAAGAGLAAATPLPETHASASSNAADSLASSVHGGYNFLNQMMDAYAQGSTVRMCQSYSDRWRHVFEHRLCL